MFAVEVILTAWYKARMATTDFFPDPTASLGWSAEAFYQLCTILLPCGETRLLPRMRGSLAAPSRVSAHAGFHPGCSTRHTSRLKNGRGVCHSSRRRKGKLKLLVICRLLWAAPLPPTRRSRSEIWGCVVGVGDAWQGPHGAALPAAGNSRRAESRILRY